MNRLGTMIVGALAVAACSTTPTAGPTAASSHAPQPTPSATPETSPTPVPTTAAIELPNPGGTCDASHFTPASAPLASFTFAAMNTRHLGITAVFRNNGPSCDMAQPATIALGSSMGPFVAREVPNAGQVVCTDKDCKTGKYVYPTQFQVDGGALVTVSFNSWWWINPDEPGLPSPRPCGNPLADITRTEIPLAAGRLAFSWDAAIETICSEPDTLALGITIGTQAAGSPAPTSGVGGPLPCAQGQIEVTPGPSGAAAGTAYLAVFVNLVHGAPCTLPAGPVISIVDASGKVFAAGTDSNAVRVAIEDETRYHIGWNVPCGPWPTPNGALSARIQLSSDWVAVMPIGDFGPSCVDGSTGNLFMDVDPS